MVGVIVIVVGSIPVADSRGSTSSTPIVVVVLVLLAALGLGEKPKKKVTHGGPRSSS